MYFDRHDAAFPVSKLQTQIGCSDGADRSDGPMHVSSSRMQITGSVRLAGEHDAVQMTGPHFRPELGAMGVHPPSREPSSPANIRSRTTFERSPRELTTVPKPHFLTRPWFTWISGAFAAALGFAVVLWLTGPVAAPPAIAILASATVSDATALMAAVQTAGLRGAPDVKGAIEGLKRIDNERVTIKGWALDRTASSPQLTIIGFAGGPHVLTTVTNGPRKDVAQMFGLSDAAARNVSFETTFTCNPGQNLVVVAVTAENTYSQFRSLACP